MLKFEEDKNYLDGYGQKVVVNGVAVGEFVSDGAKRKLRQLFKKLNS